MLGPVYLLGGFNRFINNPDAENCLGSEPIFNSMPINFTSFGYVTPIGNLNPPAHTFPTDHIYFYPNSGSFEIYAPGNITIISIAEQHSPTVTDYSINFKI